MLCWLKEPGVPRPGDLGTRALLGIGTYSAVCGNPRDLKVTLLAKRA